MTVLDAAKNLPLEIRYLTANLSVQEGEETRELEVAELVRPGAVLVTVLPADQQAKTSRQVHENKKVVLAAGENCEMSAAGTAVLSTATGYPGVELTEKDQQHVVSVAVTPMVRISRNNMLATLTVYPPIGATPSLQVEFLEQILKEAGVVFGIDRRFLQKAIDQAAAGQPVVELAVAHGMLPINGFDAHLRMEVEIGAMPGKVRGDGSIDFRERRMFVSVEEGQLIATKIKATPGIAGKTVLGQPIPQREGRDITVRVSEDAVYSEKEKTVRAAKAGVVSIVKDNTIKVSSKQAISGDVDFSVGNIYSKNAVEITGSVKPDFVVAVRGDIVIGGDIQSATVSSHGNLVVHGGIIGAESVINIRGDADVNFIENASLHAGGNVVIRKSAYYATIIAEGNITGDSKSKILGGTLICNGSFTAGDIGSDIADPAEIFVGTDIKRFQHYQELNRKIIEETQEIALWLQRHGAEAQKPAKILELERHLAENKAAIADLNLIPGSPANSALDELAIDDDAEIVVYGSIVAGTRLRIGNLTKTLTLTQSRKKFKINKGKREILAESL